MIISKMQIETRFQTPGTDENAGCGHLLATSDSDGPDIIRIRIDFYAETV
jgi:hypothetical protein